jgi:glyoxylase-like metal-dependent hydrolase (beta-lactamase superfamily II)
MYSLDILVQGYPGKTTHHGGLGWATVALLRGRGETLVVDTGSYGYRDLLVERLGAFGLKREDVTGVLITHLHWDHVCNYPFFPRARVYVPEADLLWAAGQPIGTWHLPEFHVERLAAEKRALKVRDGDEVLPGVRAVATSGHTPGHISYVARGERGGLIFAGDAVKNQAELVSERVDMTLDEAASKASLRRLRDITAANPENVLICGHDRLLGLAEGRVVHKGGLEGAILARFTPEFDRQARIDLVPD